MQTEKTNTSWLLLFQDEKLKTFEKINIKNDTTVNKHIAVFLDQYNINNNVQLERLSSSNIDDLLELGYIWKEETLIVYIENYEKLISMLYLDKANPISSLETLIVNETSFSIELLIEKIEGEKNNKNEQSNQLPLDSNQPKRNNYKGKLPPISNTIESICKSVIGQDEAVRKTVQAIYDNLNLITKDLSLSEIVTLKNNILMSGKSGCGKTEIARQISKSLNIPVCLEDITQYTGSGWIGKETNELLKKLYLLSDRKIEIAQRGILILDEVDKISINNFNDRNSHNTLEVQQCLLKIIEGSFFELDMGRLESKVPFDTRFLTIIGIGAFNGYNRKDNLSSEKQYFSKQDYINYGLMPEFVRRYKTFITLRELTDDDQKRILLESELSVLILKIRDLESRGIKINIECSLEKLCEAIIKKSKEQFSGNGGVSDLNEIAFNIFTEIYYRLYDDENLYEVTFDDTIVEDPRQVVFVKK